MLESVVYLKMLRKQAWLGRLINPKRYVFADSVKNDVIIVDYARS